MNDETIRLLLRVTARISGLLFLVAFAGHGLRAVWPSDLAPDGQATVVPARQRGR